MSVNLRNLQAITDVCLLVEDIDRTIDFYTKLGFTLRRHAEGFADFHGLGVTLAAWELDHIHQHTGVSNQRAPQKANKVCLAVELKSNEELDELYQELVTRGVVFVDVPKKYPAWQAYCAYFHDPDDTLWELYYWYGDSEYSTKIYPKSKIKK